MKITQVRWLKFIFFIYSDYNKFIYTPELDEREDDRFLSKIQEPICYEFRKNRRHLQSFLDHHSLRH